MKVDSNLVSTAFDYFKKSKGIEEDGIDWGNTGDSELISLAEYNVVEKIIALQVAFWLMRRATNNCQSNTDTIAKLISEEIKTYESKFGKFADYNEENKY